MRVKTLLSFDKYFGSFLLAILKPWTHFLGMILRRDHRLELRDDLTILKPLGGGSLVIAFPAFLGLRKRYPDLRIKLVTTKRTAPFARSLGVFDDIYEIDDSTLVRLTLSSIKVFFRSFGTDTVINLEAYSTLSMVFGLMTSSRNRLAFYLESAFWRKGVANHLFFFNRFAATPDLYDKVFQTFDVTPASQSECHDHLMMAIPEVEPVKGCRISIGHACSDLGRERMLTAEQWVSVFTSHLDAGFQAEVVFLGAAKDSALAAEIAGELSKKMPNLSCRDLCGKTSLPESLAILGESDEFWGIDSALVHYARIMNVRSVSFWGPTDPQTRLRELPGYAEEVVYRKIPCSPCIHITDVIPCAGNNICIKNLFADEIIDWIGMLT